MSNLPQPMTVTDKLLYAVVEELRALRAVLAPPEQKLQQSGAVELREPESAGGAVADTPKAPPAKRKRGRPRKVKANADG